MRATVLVSRIVRVIETDGAVGDGAALADEYDRAIRQVNSRLEEVHAAVEAKQLSDAVRIMEMEPRLIDEISTLTFRQLPEWKMMCARCRWQTPVSLDKSLLDRVLLLSESSEVVEPFLRMYRKAVMTNNHALALQSLRRLSAVDKSQDWSENLAQTEEVVLRGMVVAFRAAKEKGDDEAMQRIAQEFAENVWTGNAKVQGLVELRAFLAEKAAGQRDAVGREDIGILRKCDEGEWKRPLVFSMLQSLDGIIEQGWRVPDDAADVVERCRRRCAEEMEAEEREAQWNDASANLSAAMEAGDAAGVREALAAPVFQLRPPEEKSLAAAKAVLAKAAKAARMKQLAIAACVLVAVGVLFGVSAIFVRLWLIGQRRDAEIVKLEALAKKPHAIERLAAALAAIKSKDPDVYGEEGVRQFEDVLRGLREAALVRTNELAKIVADLSEREASQWEGLAEAELTQKLGRADEIMTADDAAFAARFAELRQSYFRRIDELAMSLHDRAVAELERIRQSAEKWNVAGKLANPDGAPFKEIAQWRREHGVKEYELAAELSKIEKSIRAKLERDAALRHEISTFDEKYRIPQSQCDASEIVDFRTRLSGEYGDYEEVSQLVRLDVNGDEAAAFLARANKGDDDGGPVSDKAFASFLRDSVLILKEAPSYFSLYGLYLQTEGAWRGADAPKYYFAAAKGEPKLVRQGGRWRVDGELLDIGAIVQHKSLVGGTEKPRKDELPSAAEIKGIVGAVRSDMSVAEFEGVLLRAIAVHLKAAKDKEFLKVETVEDGLPLMQGRYPAIRRVQLVNLYFSWLHDDMNVMPDTHELTQWRLRLAKLAQSVLIDGVDDDMTWLCLKNQRVNARNKECANLLAEMSRKKVLETYKTHRKAMISLGRIMRWNVECVGAIPVSGAAPRLDAAPHYLLRRKDAKIELLRIGGDVVPLAGEPVYVVKEPGGAQLDVHAELEKIMRAVPEDVWKSFATKIPFL